MEKRDVLLSFLILATIIFSAGWVSQYEIERDYNTGTFAPQGYAYTAVDQQSYTIASRGKAGFAGFYLSTYSDTGASTIFLPEDPADGTQLTIVDGDLNAGSNNIVLTPSGSNTVGETTSYTLANDGETVTAQFVESGDGNWHIIAGSLSLASGATIAGAVTQDGGAVFNEAGADQDFRVESDTGTHAIFVDGGNNRVGVFTTAPTVPFEVTGQTLITGATAITGALTQTGAVTQDGGVVTMNEAGADYDFRVESDNITDALKVDAGTNTVYHGAWSAYKTVTAAQQSYSVTSASRAHIVEVDYTTTEAATVHLMTELLTSPGAGTVLWIVDKDGNGNTNNIVVDTEGEEKINGADTYTIDADYGALQLYTDGTHWFVLKASQ